MGRRGARSGGPSRGSQPTTRFSGATESARHVGSQGPLFFIRRKVSCTLMITRINCHVPCLNSEGPDESAHARSLSKKNFSAR